MEYPSANKKTLQPTHNPAGIRGNNPGGAGRGRITHNSPRMAWDAIEGDELKRFICDVTSVGGAVVLGTTSDGGALSVTVLMGSEKLREWPASLAAFQAMAQAFRERYVLGLSET